MSREAWGPFLASPGMVVQEPQQALGQHTALPEQSWLVMQACAQAQDISSELDLGHIASAVGGWGSLWSPLGSSSKGVDRHQGLQPPEPQNNISQRGKSFYHMCDS